MFKKYFWKTNFGNCFAYDEKERCLEIFEDCFACTLKNERDAASASLPRPTPSQPFVEKRGFFCAISLLIVFILFLFSSCFPFLKIKAAGHLLLKSTKCTFSENKSNSALCLFLNFSFFWTRKTTYFAGRTSAYRVNNVGQLKATLTIIISCWVLGRPVGNN